MWWKDSFISRRNWILHHLPSLDVTLSEGMMLLMLDFMQEFSKEINLDTLSSALHLKKQETDQLLGSLVAKGYVSVATANKKVEFRMDGLYESVQRTPMSISSDLFDVFEQEFGRPLTRSEMEKLSEHSRTHSDQLIIYALREATIAKKVSMAYISRILSSWKAKNITVEQLESGDRHDTE